MSPHKIISDTFNSTLSISEVEEDYRSYRLCGTITSKSIPTNGITNQYLITIEDDFQLDIKIGESESITYFSGKNFDDFIESLSDLSESFSEDEEIISCELTIWKSFSSHFIRIYNTDEFFKKMNSYDLNGLLFVFKQLKLHEKKLAFHNLDNSVSFETQSIIFHSELKNINEKETSSERGQILKKSQENAHFGQNDDYLFIPDDFKIVSQTGLSNELSFFDRLALIYSIGFIFDITSYDRDADLMFFKINGYRSIIIKKEFKKIETIFLETYYMIYQWVYGGQDISDKTGLARNLITLHLKEKQSIAIDGNVLNSIRSGYKIYLKENVRQYIEIRNKISSDLTNLSKDVVKAGEKYTNNFQKSVFAFLSLFGSIVVIRVLKSNGFDNILTNEAALLIFSFLLITVLFLFYSKSELKMEKERIDESYKNLKDRYNDLLTPKDINKIVNNDAPFNSDKNYLAERERKTSNLWWSIILILFVIISIMWLKK